MIRDCTRDCGMCPAGLITRTCTSTWKTVHVALQHDTYVVHSTFTYYYHYRIDNVRSVIYVIVIGMSDFTTEHSALWTSKKIIDKLYSAFERERERERIGSRARSFRNGENQSRENIPYRWRLSILEDRWLFVVRIFVRSALDRALNLVYNSMIASGKAKVGQFDCALSWAIVVPLLAVVRDIE